MNNNFDNVEDEIENSELGKIIYSAVENLPEKCKEIFQLVKYESLSYKETAEVLGISPKTVENQMGIALKKLREELIPKIKN